jgi:hypothetical protein
MNDFFASVYEWFGLIPFYSRDLGDHLRGWDITCTDYIGTSWYIYVGWIMISMTSFFYALMYHVIDSPRFNRRTHWWMIAGVVFVLNFLIAFAIPFNSIQAGDYCQQLNITTADCLGFGLSNALVSIVVFTIISSIPLIRRVSRNCRNTTFWKP